MKIAIYGAGYIGLSLFSHLGEHDVTVITRTHHKEYALFPHLSHERNTPEEIKDTLKKSDIIICTVAPHAGNYSVYPKSATLLTRAHPDSYFIYTSSIGVYGDAEGDITEETRCIPTTERAKSLYEAEQIFLKSKNACIFRLGGIYGPQRPILHRLLEQGLITGPKNWPTNMVHQEDAIGAILFAIDTHIKGVFNLVDCEHPSREDLYTQISEYHQIALPQWDESQPLYHGGNKKIHNNKLLHEGFHFSHPTKNLSNA